jgi:two-component sensor histidine kinase/sensor domain CHASE-containing protein
MSLKTKFSILLTGLFLGLLLVNISTLSFVVFPAFEELETREAKKNMGRVIDVLESDIKGLDLFVFDWASWEDTYDFIKDRNQKYIDVNYIPDYALQQNHDLYFIWDLKGKTILNKALNEDGSSFLTFDDFYAEGLPANHPFLTLNTLTSKSSGLIQTKQGPMIIVARPVFEYAAKSPIRGILAIGRYLDKVVIENISKRTNLNLDIWSLTGNQVGDIPKDAPKNLKTGDSEIVLAQDKKTIFIYSSYADIFGNPVILLRVSMPRDIVNQGKSTLSYGIGMALISGIMIVAILLIIIQRSIVSPLSSLAKNIIRLGKRENVSQQFPVNREDELGEVARSVITGYEERNKAELVTNCQNYVLRKLSQDDLLDEIFDGLIGLVEKENPKTKYTILFLSPEQKTLGLISAPGLPKTYKEYIEDVQGNSTLSACGVAASKNEIVIVADIKNDPLWLSQKSVALSHGLKACWSFPIEGMESHAMGALDIYCSEARIPTQEELDLGDSMVRLIALSVERKQIQCELEEYQKNLKAIIEVRTKELQKANQKLIEEIKDRIKIAEDLETSLGEKDVLLQEVNHRTKNNMQIITSLIHMQTKKIKDKEYLKLFQESYDRINSMSLLQDKIFTSQNLQKIETFGYFKSLVDELLTAYSQKTRQNISFKLETNKIALDVGTGINCGLIVNELISNSLKHAFPDMNSGEIMLTLISTGEGQYELIVRDTGVGIPEEVDLSNPETTGLKLVTQLGKRNLEGVIDWERTPGTKFKITFNNPSFSVPKEKNHMSSQNK